MSHTQSEREAVAVITGSAGVGCGRAIANRFARDGYFVVVSDIDDVRGLDVLNALLGSGVRAAYRSADVRDERQIDELLAFACECGSLRVLVNNASATFHPEDPLGYWSPPLETDLLGAVHASLRAIERMAHGGAVVNMTSISALWHGRSRRFGSPAYEVAKAGLLRFTTALAPFTRDRDVRINALAPGWIGVPEVLDYYNSLTPQERIENEVPSRLLTVEQVADAVAYLAGEATLNGRILEWPSEEPQPRLISWGDRGYERSEPIEIPRAVARAME
jgi:NAD(P)-dependent dehydrogenase (short-subunit alcohol dehydrogenase family)